MPMRTRDIKVEHVPSASNLDEVSLMRWGCIQVSLSNLSTQWLNVESRR